MTWLCRRSDEHSRLDCNLNDAMIKKLSSREQVVSENKESWFTATAAGSGNFGGGGGKCQKKRVGHEMVKIFLYSNYVFRNSYCFCKIFSPLLLAFVFGFYY